MPEIEAESIQPVHAGCVAGPDSTNTGCANRDRETGRDEAPPEATSDSTGCAAPATSDETSGQAKPPQTMREFERALRSLGFTRLQAEHIARRGFSGASTEHVPEPAPPSEPDETIQLRKAVERLARSMRT